MTHGRRVKGIELCMNVRYFLPGMSLNVIGTRVASAAETYNYYEILSYYHHSSSLRNRPKLMS